MSRCFCHYDLHAVNSRWIVVWMTACCVCLVWCTQCILASVVFKKTEIWLMLKESGKYRTALVDLNTAISVRLFQSLFRASLFSNTGVCLKESQVSVETILLSIQWFPLIGGQNSTVSLTIEKFIVLSK